MRQDRVGVFPVILLIAVLLSTAPASLAEGPYDEAIARFAAWATERMEGDDAGTEN